MNAQKTVRSATKAFTMVEMLIVIVIILMLSAILLRSAAMFGESGRRARAVSDLEHLQNLISEYRQEYGHYPPVQSMAYEYESTNLQNQAVRDGFYERDPVRAEEGVVTGDDIGYRYGLVAHLWPRRRGHQVQTFNEDTARDRAAKARWEPFREPLRLSVGNRSYSADDVRGLVGPSYDLDVGYSNRVATLRDPWGREYQYRSHPPYQRYEVWSYGPGGSGNPEDNIAFDSWSE